MLPLFISYTDGFGLIHTSKNGPGDNGLAYTSEAYTMSYLGGQDFISDEWEKVVIQCEQVPGLMTRYPDQVKQEQIDDYLELTCAAIILNRINILKRIRQRGEGSKVTLFDVLESQPGLSKNLGKFESIVKYISKYIKVDYYLNNKDPDNKLSVDGFAWLGRFPAWLALVEMGTGSTPALWKRVWLAISIFLAAREPKSNQDGWRQSHLMVLAHKRVSNPSWLVNLSSWYWWKKKPVAMKQIIAEYLGDPSSPFVEVWDDYK